MVVSVEGEFYVFETEKDPAREELKSLFQELGENDIVEVRVQGDSNNGRKVYYVSKIMLDNDLDFFDAALSWEEDVFKKASQVCPPGLVMPVMDGNGNCVNIITKVDTSYDHFYHYDGGMDLCFLNRYDSIVMVGLNEYSVELYRKAIPLWQGKEVYLFGNGWEDYIKILPAPANVKVTILYQAAQWRKLQEESGRSERKLLSMIEGVGSEGTSARYEQGILYYDEIMILTFFFSYVIHPGNRNPDARFLLIDGRFYITGMFAIWDRVFAAARYAIAKGYIPIFMIVSADSSMYSDHEGDDIWNKFFLQPSGYALEEVLQSSYLALSPNTFLIKNTLRRIMDEISAGYEFLCPGEVFNEQVKAYIRERQRIFLPCPERTLGVMIRGTDYIHNPFPNHAKQATAEQVIQKIAEVEGEWEFDWIYLATEDADVCLRMKEEYGERILFTDQERYRVEPGHLLIELHKEKNPGEGFRLGVEYLCTINLLAQCSSLIASGGCCGLTETLRENEGRYKNIYIFELGTT